MRKEEVPQDHDMNEGIREIAYAVDPEGRYVRVQSLGWEPKNTVNAQAWEVIERDIREQIRLIRAGKRSPLAYYMAKNLMDAGLLSSYAGFWRWQVIRHLKPDVFNKLKPEILARYAEVFGISVEELTRIPDISPS
jgi:hypothetical protein